VDFGAIPDYAKVIASLMLIPHLGWLTAWKL